MDSTTTIGLFYNVILVNNRLNGSYLLWGKNTDATTDEELFFSSLSFYSHKEQGSHKSDT